ncbi:hypothetical protein I6G82_12435 [Lysinibacillus macroides]|uniref:Uncharacterized protein n=1 Tax=Lysinibacillus macroides TaxID=33935 RepID=A0A0M9DKN5_9BACI|nr:hypothetical protein [Lysinibacillus macroides]KOY82839.1 hypothetical protein ADM90_05825 [Lysinibacillus macroides]QPR66111.1 hypothetical protein I6G82_12435 [Lysinibacillus macroides]
MTVIVNSIQNLGWVANSQTNQTSQSFKIGEGEIDSKKAEIETSRKEYAEFIQSSSSIYQGATPTQLVNKQTNSINIVAGVYYNLGTVNGKPLNGTPLASGGFNSNFSPKIWKVPGSSIVTPEQEAALKMRQSYSLPERQEANELVAVFMSLSRLAEGKKSVDSMNNDAMFMQHFPKFAKGIGLDLSQPFTINGKSFTYSQGTLQTTSIED